MSEAFQSPYVGMGERNKTRPVTGHEVAITHQPTPAGSGVCGMIQLTIYAMCPVGPESRECCLADRQQRVCMRRCARPSQLCWAGPG